MVTKAKRQVLIDVLGQTMFEGFYVSEDPGFGYFEDDVKKDAVFVEDETMYPNNSDASIQLVIRIEGDEFVASRVGQFFCMNEQAPLYGCREWCEECTHFRPDGDDEVLRTTNVWQVVQFCKKESWEAHHGDEEMP